MRYLLRDKDVYTDDWPNLITLIYSSEPFYFKFPKEGQQEINNFTKCILENIQIVTKFKLEKIFYKTQGLNKVICKKSHVLMPSNKDITLIFTDNSKKVNVYVPLGSLLKIRKNENWSYSLPDNSANVMICS